MQYKISSVLTTSDKKLQIKHGLSVSMPTKLIQANNAVSNLILIFICNNTAFQFSAI